MVVVSKGYALLMENYMVCLFIFYLQRINNVSVNIRFFRISTTTFQGNTLARCILLSFPTRSTAEIPISVKIVVILIFSTLKGNV